MTANFTLLHCRFVGLDEGLSRASTKAAAPPSPSLRQVLLAQGKLFCGVFWPEGRSVFRAALTGIRANGWLQGPRLPSTFFFWLGNPRDRGISR
jgi:hypothetical protein